MRVRVRGVNTVQKRLASGERVTYFYHRATGIRLEGRPNTPEFLTSYAGAEKTLKARHSGDTFNGLVRTYTGSIEFETKLSSASQREYKRMLAKTEPGFGEMPREALIPSLIEQNRWTEACLLFVTPRQC